MNRLERTRAALIAAFPLVWIQPGTEAFEIRDEGVFWTPDGTLNDKSHGNVIFSSSSIFRRSPDNIKLSHRDIRVISDYVAARTTRHKA